MAGESVAGNEIGFSQADFFSREIQGNTCPGNSPDDGEDIPWGGRAWHFPVTDWELDERFVVRIPVKWNEIVIQIMMMELIHAGQGILW